MAYGLKFFKEKSHIFNAILCISALVLDLSLHGSSKIEAVITLMFLRLIRLMYTIYEVTAHYDEEKYEKLEKKF